jgi:hypothetical protein
VFPYSGNQKNEKACVTEFVYPLEKCREMKEIIFKKHHKNRNEHVLYVNGLRA